MAHADSFNSGGDTVRHSAITKQPYTLTQEEILHHWLSGTTTQQQVRVNATDMDVLVEGQIKYDARKKAQARRGGQQMQQSGQQTGSATASKKAHRESNLTQHLAAPALDNDDEESTLLFGDVCQSDKLTPHETYNRKPRTHAAADKRKHIAKTKSSTAAVKYSAEVQRHESNALQPRKALIVENNTAELYDAEPEVAVVLGSDLKVAHATARPPDPAQLSSSMSDDDALFEVDDWSEALMESKPTSVKPTATRVRSFKRKAPTFADSDDETHSTAADLFAYESAAPSQP